MAFAIVGCAAPAPKDTVVGEYLSARVAAFSHDIDGAAAAYANVKSKTNTSVDIQRAAFYFRLAAGHYDEMIAIADQLVRQPDADSGGFAQAALAARAMRAGDYSTAVRLIEEAGEDGFPRPAANIIGVWALAGRDGDAAALARLRNVPGEEYRGFYPLHAALLSENLGRTDDARNAYQLSIMAFSGSTEISAYGAFLERSGDDAATREYYELLASQEGLGRFAGRFGLARLDEAAPAPGAEPTTPVEGAAIALYSLANGILQDTWQRREAAAQAGMRVGDANYNIPLAMTRLALYLNPDLDDAKRFAGSILNVYERYDEAIDLLSSVRAQSPYFEQARIEIASAHQRRGDVDAAIDALHDVLRRHPEAIDAQLTLAGIFAGEQRHQEAIAIMDDVISGLPDEPLPIAWRYFLTRGASLLEVGDWPLAEADLKRAVDIAPDEATALNYLGYSWAERGENLEEAFELIERAAAIEPTSGAIIDSLGWAHYQLGEYEKAVVHLEQAAALEPADPVITDHLGDVYWRLGRQLEARYQWERVLELEPKETLAESIAEKIKNGLADADN